MKHILMNFFHNWLNASMTLKGGEIGNICIIQCCLPQSKTEQSYTQQSYTQALFQYLE